MPRKKTKAAPRRKRVTARRKAITRQSQNNWQMGAGIFALAAVLGFGAYMLSTNIDTRTTVAALVERFEVPDSAGNRTASLQPPEQDATERGPIESAPVR